VIKKSAVKTSSFLKDYAGASSLNLKKAFPDNYKLLAAQFTLYPKAILKMPEFTSNYCYLTPKSYEQSSSEALAQYKASLFEGETLFDLSGGLGIDDIAFSTKFKTVVSIDSDSELNLIADVNFCKLDIQNIERITANSEDYINNVISADLVYIDADRRAGQSGKKSVTLHDSSPNVLQMLNRLFEITPQVLIKLSPLTDITYINKNLSNIKEVRVVSLENEVKEILVLLDKNHTGLPLITAVDIQSDGNVKEFSSSEISINETQQEEEQIFFFEPATALVKAGLADNYAANNNIQKISKRGKFYTSAKLPADSFGRVFRIVCHFPFGKSVLAKYLRDCSIQQANVSASNFPVKPEEIKKTFAIKDGGIEYFFFTKNYRNEKLFFHCRKL